MNDTAIQRSDQDALSSVLRRKKLPAPVAQPRPVVDAATVRSDRAQLTTVLSAPKKRKKHH